ncbi:multisubunit sodium/proton antiporter, MrpA subunit [Deinococcus reticulitermitis]|uniref:Multisubunit sodium/proton antiporter, MrpA subunit n=1 Tax=Deinococcus reticulitermitis TaxID=856736 RepID=A0A1H6XKE8_9DEIO|nr:hydrogen gas-evolving membrane-bound hydrogenase subunit E [Deinococcus reticulitermitis]SEJ27207.1 multisubunit sodium/proton antiporter, MrpA subunit [Deinococcus reticulitermitis]
MTIAVLLPFVLAALCAVLAPQLGRRTGYVAALAFLPAVLLAAPLLAGEAPRTEVVSWVPEIGLNLVFRGDGFSLLFAALIGVIGALASLYSVAYLSPTEKFGRFYPYLLLFGGSMLGLVLSDNLVALFGFWEMTSVTSFLLIGLWHTRSAARDGAVKAFLVSALGGLGLLAAAALLSIAGGSTNLSELDLAAVRASPLFVPALLLTLLAAFTKSAQLPFHLWLPTAMEAPTPVSAFLHSATMVKAGVVLVAKFGLIFGTSALWSGVIVPVGLLTMAWGSWLALRQTDLKALLAYSTISQLGLLMGLYGLANEEGRFAATAHLLNHAAFKAALFFVVGIVDHETGTRTIPFLHNLRRVMPVTFVIATLATLSMAGLPPLGGFISKELFYEAMLHAGPAYITVAVIGSALTFAYCARLLSIFFPLRVGLSLTQRALRQDAVKEHVHEAPLGLTVPAGLLAVTALLFGVWPQAAEALTRSAGTALAFAAYDGSLKLWHGVTPALLLTGLTWVLGGLLVWQAPAFAGLQSRLSPLWNANTVYYSLVQGLSTVASRVIARTQGLALPDQIRISLIAAGLMGGYAVWRAPQVFHSIGDLPLTILPIAVLLVAGAVGVVLSRNRLTAVVVTGLTGFGSASAFLAFRAPDLALTQLLVEAVTVILFLLAFRYLPGVRDLPRTRGRLVLDAGIALGAGVGITLLVLSSLRFLAPPISPWYLVNSYVGGGGKNAVNVLLVDFRGFDTLGEGLVVAMVALAVSSLVRLGKPGRPVVGPAEVPDHTDELPSGQTRIPEEAGGAR